ncbi:MAG: hypothetical protein ABIJ56_22425, partial [Pseudomonadota bacterium]
TRKEITMRNILTTLLAALLIAACGSGQKTAEAPAGRKTDAPAPAGQDAAPEPAGQAEQMNPDELAVTHIAHVINILRDLTIDCEAAQQQSLEYIERNKQEIINGVTYGKNKEDGLQGEAKDAYGDKMEALLDELAPDYKRVLERYGDSCPDQKEAIGSAMGL